MALLRLVGLLFSALAAVASGTTSNPFRGRSSSDFYINPINFQQYEQSIVSASGQIKSNLKEMQAVPSAYWIDVKEKIRAKGTADDVRSLEGILQDAASKPRPQLCVFMWYDLPNRDCKAKASNGQICCNKNADGSCNYKAGGDCAEGLREYKEEYADPFIQVLRDYQHRVPIVVVVEPDSLPNLATNMAHPHCGSSATQAAYKEGISYALHQLVQKTPEVTVYLDAAHGGWMGWENSMEKFMRVLKGMNLPKIRGFATNVANYQPLGTQCPWSPDQGFRNGYCLNGQHKNHECCADPCGLTSQWNFGNNELNYAAGLVAAADQMLGWDAHVVIDTGRNGVVDHRSKCNSWCNPRGAGAGVKSTADVANSSLVDAYFWLKTPGESDGCTEILPEGGRCPRFDYDCGSEDSLGSRAGEPRSPEAGRWFDYQVKELAEKANFRPPNNGHHNFGPYPRPTPPGPRPTPGPAPYPAPRPVPGDNSGYADCASDVSNCIKVGCCKTSGHKCFMKDGYTAFCRSSAPAGWWGHVIHKSSAPAPGPAPGPAPRPAPVPAPPSGTDGTCSAAFGQCGGKNWNGPTCCQSGCQCRHEGEWYSQCEPPAGNHMCGAAAETIIYAQDVHLEDRAGSAVSLNRVMMAGVAMMLVMGAGFTAIKVVRRQQQLSRGAESGTLLIDTYDATDTEDEEIPGTE